MREKLIEMLRCEKRCPKSLEHCGEDCPYFDISKAYCCDEDSATADMLIANGVTVQQWIPVSERLPEPDVDVLAFNGDYIFISQYYRSHFASWDKVGHMCWMKDQYAKNPTHWMPLPPAPKEG